MAAIISYFRKLFFKKKVLFLSFSDSKNCPCFHVFDIVRKKKFPHALNLNSLKLNEEAINSINVKRLIIYAHGSEQKLDCYFKKRTQNTVKDIDIPKEFWYNFNPIEGLVYFHVCYGSKIIQNINKGKLVFPNWVSYKDAVDSFYLNDEKVNKIMDQHTFEVNNAVSTKKSPDSLSSAIKSSYYKMISNLQDEKTNKPIEGCYFMIQAFSRNVRLLETSTLKI